MPTRGAKSAIPDSKRVQDRKVSAGLMRRFCSFKYGKRGGENARYRMVYGDDEQVRETFDDVLLEREAGWVVLFRGSDAILRIREEDVQSLEVLPSDA